MHSPEMKVANAAASRGMIGGSVDPLSLQPTVLNFHLRHVDSTEVLLPCYTSPKKLHDTAQGFRG